MTTMTETKTTTFIAINRGFEVLGDLTEHWASKISAERVFIRTRDAIPPGTPVNLCFAVFLKEPHIVRGEGVVTANETLPHRGIEVRFTRLDESSVHLIEHIVRSARL